MDKECARDRGKGGEQEKKQWRDGETDGREDVEEMQRGRGGGGGGWRGRKMNWREWREWERLGERREKEEEGGGSKGGGSKNEIACLLGSYFSVLDRGKMV